MTNIHKNPLFDLGRTMATPAAIEALQESNVSPNSLLCRHQCGDWGDLCDEDLAENNLALRHRYRLFSSYQITETIKILIITEADRSVTTLLLPEDY